MICNKCNHKLPDDSEFCQYCGAKIEVESEDEVSESQTTILGESQIQADVLEEIDDKQSETVIEDKVKEIDDEQSETVAEEQVEEIKSEDNTITENTIEKKKKVRYCSRCGALIDSETKQCTGCGKKYFKGIRFNKLFFSVFAISLFFFLLTGIIIYQCTQIKALEEKSSDLQSEIDILNNQKSALEDEKWNNYFELKFFQNYAEIVPDDNSNTYHKYGCSDLDTSEGFWIFNSDAAKGKGYVKCKVCH